MISSEMHEKTKHIVFVNHTRELHGSEQVMLETLHLCKAQGWRVTLVLPINRPDGGLEKAVGKDIDILYLNYKNAGDGFARTIAIELYNLPAVLRLIRWIQKNKPDLIYSNTSVALPGVEAARWTHTPHIWHWHELPGKDFGWSKLSIYILRFWQKYSTKLLFISATQKEMWEKALGKKTLSNALVIYNPLRKIQTLESQQEKPIRIGYVGSFIERKNIIWLIQTVARLSAKYPLQLDLYGAKNEQEKEYLYSFWKNTSAFTIHDFTDNVESAYAEMDIFVLPSWSETMPLVVMEAMQAGVCVIQTNHSCMTELMRNEQECLFIDPISKDSLNEAFIKCMDTSYRRKIAAQGQCFVKEWMAKNDYSRHIISLFHNLINQ